MINSIKKDIFFIYQMISDAMQLLSVMHRVCTLCVWKSNKFIENRKKYFRESSAITKEIWDKCKRVKNAKMLITIEKTIDSLKCMNIQLVKLKYTVKTKYCYLSTSEYIIIPLSDYPKSTRTMILLDLLSSYCNLLAKKNSNNISYVTSLKK